MSKGRQLKETFKRLGCPEVDELDEKELDSFFASKSLAPFLEVFCTLNEDNVLTTEELEEYASLTSDELKEIENFRKSVNFDEIPEIDKKHEACYLQERLLCIEDHNKALEREIDLFKQHEKELNDEKDACENHLKFAKKKLQLYEILIIPSAVNQFVSDLASILDIAKELETLITDSDKILPSSNIFKDHIRGLFDDEENIIECVKTFMQQHFTLDQNNALTLITSENSRNEELQKEVEFLQKTVRKTAIEKVMSEKEFIKVETMLKYINSETSDMNHHLLQSRNMLEGAMKINKVLKEKEEELITCITVAINKNIDSTFAKVYSKLSEETLKYINYYNDMLSLPLNALTCQRIRLEILLALLHKFHEELKYFKQLLEITQNEIINEEKKLLERKVQVEEKDSNELSQSVLDPETSIYLALYKILVPYDDPVAENLQRVVLEDVFLKAKEFLADGEKLKQKEKENLKHLNNLEECFVSMQKLLKCSNKRYHNWHELEQAASSNLNNLDIKLALLEKTFFKFTKDVDQKQKLLYEKENMRLARKLFVHALLNKELFKEYINDIKLAVYKSKSF